MIILLSPAKTFSKNQVEPKTKPLFDQDASLLAGQLKKIPLKSIQNKMRLSSALASAVYGYYDHFGQSLNSAIYAYDGYAFKGFDVHTLDQKSLTYLQDHLYIMSGLYGLVRPFDGISYYRLEMQDSTILNLYQYWRKKVNDYLCLNHSNAWLINLASNEYSQLLDSSHQILTISFLQKKNGQYKTISMHTKKARGMMARHLIMHQIQDVQEIKSITFDGYQYNALRSTEYEFVFIKELTL